MASRARWNGFTGRIWPAGRSLETPGIEEDYRKFFELAPLPITRKKSLVTRATTDARWI